MIILGGSSHGSFLSGSSPQLFEWINPTFPTQKSGVIIYVVITYDPWDEPPSILDYAVNVVVLADCYNEAALRGFVAC